MSTNLYDTNIVITRNEVQLPHIWTDFKRGEAKKQGKKFPAPSIENNAEGIAAFCKFLDPENVHAILTADYNIYCQQTQKVVEKELEENLKLVVGSPEYNNKFVELFSKYMTDLTTRGESKAELLAANLKLSEQVAELTEKAMTYQETDPVKAISFFMDIKKCMDTIRKNNLAIASKARTRKSDDEDESDATVPTPANQ